MRFLVRGPTLAFLVLALFSIGPVPASDPPPVPASETGSSPTVADVPPSSPSSQSAQAWTLEAALAQMRLYPRDPYLQFVALQLARREGKEEDTIKEIEELIGRRGRPEGRENPDLFSIFTGALAVQESLQLETMRSLPTADRTAAAATPDDGEWRTVTETCTKKVPVTTCHMEQVTCVTKEGKEYTVTKPVYVTTYKEVQYTVERRVRVTRKDMEAHPPKDQYKPTEEEHIPFFAEGPPPKPSGSDEDLAPRPVAAKPEPPDEAPAAKVHPESLPVAELAGPDIKSHPWKKLLAGRTPDVDPLARCVPHDFYFVSFRSLSKLLDAARVGDLWGRHLFTQATREAWTQPVIERAQRQLAISATRLPPAFLDSAVAEVAITGSDLFVREGSDLTLLFRVKQPGLFRVTMDGFLVQSEKDRPDARRQTGEYLGVEYVHLTTPDRAVHVFAADPTPELHVRSNSRVAFERVLAAIQGKAADGSTVRRLGDTREFAYIRTLMPRGAAEEDGFVYLSDPFIRNLVGPKLKIIERRRVQCANHLQMIAHAALLFRTEHGRAPKSLEELVEAGCCPAGFNEELNCPHGGCYALAEDGMSGVCTCHGHAHDLTPCAEIDLDEVSGEEADAYAEFLDNYAHYWRSYFDPIALRLQITPERYRLETIVLPLIDNSIYSALAKVLGGQPEALDALPVPKRNIFSLMFRINKDALSKEVNGEEGGTESKEDVILDSVADILDMVGADVKDLDLRGFLKDGIGNQLGVHAYDHDTTFYLSLPGLFGLGNRGIDLESGGIGLLIGALNSPGYLSLPVQDAKVVDAFLDRLDTFLARMARQKSGQGLNLELYRLRSSAVKARGYTVAYGPVKFRVFWARIGDGLYLATKPYILDDIAAAATTEPGPAAHAMFRARAQNWDKVLGDYRLAWAENQRSACLDNLGPLSGVGRALHGAPDAGGWDTRRVAEQVYGVRFRCPEGGRYVWSPEGKTCSCSVHGSVLEPRQGLTPSRHGLHELLRDFRGLTTTFTFLEDGLHAVLTVDRK
jgi:hypothetical protein